MNALSRLAADYRDRRVLVTGGAGFIGSQLVQVLAAGGATVCVFDNLRDGRISNLGADLGCVTFFEGDVRDGAAVTSAVKQCSPQVVFHLAANASVPRSVDDPVDDFSINATGTLVLLEAVRLSGGCERFVLASSGAVYGQPTSFPITEEHPLRPISPYGSSKQCAEAVGWCHSALHAIPVVVARLFNSFGPRMARFVVLDFLRKLRADPSRLEILGTGRQVRDFTYVADTVQGLAILGLTGTPGEAYNVSSGRTCDVTDLARTLLEILGLVGKTELTYTGTSWPGDAQRWEVSIAKLSRLGYEPEYPLRRGLDLVVDWFGRDYPVGSNTSAGG